MRLNYEDIKQHIELYGYKLISPDYKKSNIKLNMICDNNHFCSISWDNFKQGRRCRECAKYKKANLFKLNYNDVKNYIETYGCKLISEEYINNASKLKIKCSCGEIYNISFGKFKDGDRYKKCIKCRDIRSKKLSYSYIKSFIEKFGYILVSDSYIDANSKLKITCPSGHIYDVKFSNFYSGKRCPHCSGNYRMTINEVKSYINDIGYICLDSEYKNLTQKLNLICDNGHNIKMTMRELKDGCRCKICGMSKGERVIKNYLIRHNIGYIYDQPYFKDLLSDLGNPLRPDFILPDYKIWIEYDGEFHYKKMYDADGHELLKIYDGIKDRYSKKNGWKLIRIPYWEFDNIENILEKEI